MSATSSELTDSYLFRDLPAADKAEWSRLASRRALAAGERLFSQGDKATGLFVVLSGGVRVFKLSPDGRRQVLHTFGPGEPVGEVAMLSGGAYPANAEAAASTTLAYLERSRFLQALGESPQLAMNLLATLAGRLKLFTEVIEDLSFKEVSARLAGHLLAAWEAQGRPSRLTLPGTKGELADQLGTAPETLSRTMGKLEQAGLLQVKGRSLGLPDPEGLRRIVEAGRLERDKETR